MFHLADRPKGLFTPKAVEQRWGCHMGWWVGRLLKWGLKCLVGPVLRLRSACVHLVSLVTCCKLVVFRVGGFPYNRYRDTLVEPMGDL